jgi:hypothetical protein
MVRSVKRFEDLIKGLSPRDKARLAIEDALRERPVMDYSEKQKILQGMSPEEGRQYNQFVNRFQTLRLNILALFRMCAGLIKLLLERDRLLWYYAALNYLEEELTFDIGNKGASRTLLVDNPNLQPNKPVEIKVHFATIRLGVWGKKRSPVSSKGGVTLNKDIIEILDSFVEGIRLKAAESKTVFNYVIEECETMGMDIIAGMAIEYVSEVATHDRSFKRISLESEGRLARWKSEGLVHEEIIKRILTSDSSPKGGSVFPVEDRWALEWNEIEEDAEIAERIRKDPGEWATTMSADGLSNEMFDYFKSVAKKDLSL